MDKRALLVFIVADFFPINVIIPFLAFAAMTFLTSNEYSLISDAKVSTPGKFIDMDRVGEYVDAFLAISPYEFGRYLVLYVPLAIVLVVATLLQRRRRLILTPSTNVRILLFRVFHNTTFLGIVAIPTCVFGLFIDGLIIANRDTTLIQSVSMGGTYCILGILGILYAFIVGNGLSRLFKKVVIMKG